MDHSKISSRSFLASATEAAVDHENLAAAWSEPALIELPPEYLRKTVAKAPVQFFAPSVDWNKDIRAAGQVGEA